MQSSNVVEAFVLNSGFQLFSILLCLTFSLKVQFVAAFLHRDVSAGEREMLR